MSKGLDIDNILSGDDGPKKPGKSSRVGEKKKPVDDDFVRINITLRKSELEELDQFVIDLVDAGDIPEKNRSFVLRKAFRFFKRNYTY